MHDALTFIWWNRMFELENESEKYDIVMKIWICIWFYVWAAIARDISHDFSQSNLNSSQMRLNYFH